MPPSSDNVVSGSGYFTHPCPGMTYQSSYFGEIREFEVGGTKGMIMQRQKEHLHMQQRQELS